ncbi:hypothetical protein K3495_g15720, partial [Podosphaera aphanis]
KKWVLPLKDKSSIIHELNEWGNMVERQSGCPILAVRSDNAGEILKVLKTWKRHNGVVSQCTAPYSSHQNGAAERAIQTTVYTTRAMIKEAKLPVEFWSEAAKTHTYITNRIRPGPAIKKIIDGQEIIKHVSPEEAWTGDPVTIRHFKVFGCKAFGHIDRKSHPKGSRKDKLMDVARECIFMGYTDTPSQHRLYAPDLHKVVVSSYAKFKEEVRGSSILDLRLWKNSGLEFIEGQSNSAPAIRNQIGRPSQTIRNNISTKIGSFSTNHSPSEANIPRNSLVKITPEIEKVTNIQLDPLSIPAITDATDKQSDAPSNVSSLIDKQSVHLSNQQVSSMDESRIEVPSKLTKPTIELRKTYDNDPNSLTDIITERITGLNDPIKMQGINTISTSSNAPTIKDPS